MMHVRENKIDNLRPQFGMYIVALYPGLCKYQFVTNNYSITLLIKGLWLWCLMPLSTILQLNHGGQLNS